MASVLAAGYGLNIVLMSEVWHFTSTASAVAGVILAQMTTNLGGYALPSENAFKVVLAVGQVGATAKS
ncbi:hypothetical protein [Streptomyces sp. SD31]|uniref:hypothetical protein n=1 Tax=Streptomyces sp. SD31 TaxID=3452208 RepID=UPI003F8933FC